MNSCELTSERERSRSKGSTTYLPSGASGVAPGLDQSTGTRRFGAGHETLGLGRGRPVHCLRSFDQAMGHDSSSLNRNTPGRRILDLDPGLARTGSIWVLELAAPSPSLTVDDQIVHATARHGLSDAGFARSNRSPAE
jgi:hypothetical protein